MAQFLALVAFSLASLATALAQEPQLPEGHVQAQAHGGHGRHRGQALEKGSVDRPGLSKAERLGLIQRAQIWTPTPVGEMDIRRGPQGDGAFAPNAAVTCRYVDVKLPGHTPKFSCAIDEQDIVKVRYGPQNPEVEGSVLASRLLWALGFGADRVYPVRVTCVGCPADPWFKHGRTDETHVFDPAVIERKPEGHEMRMTNGEEAGWAWPELALVDPTKGGAPLEQRDGLTLLAAFMQHTDNKAEQQRLLCPPGGLTPDGHCNTPYLILHDVGLTFGHANFSNGAATGGVNYEEWSHTPVWRDVKRCIGHLSKSHTGTLGDPKISEAGRAFLSGLLAQLTDAQLHDLFDVAQVQRRRIKDDSDSGAASVEEWVAAFKRKRAEIASTRCAS
jgi:hypothetical protein